MGVAILWSCLGAKETRLHCGLELEFHSQTEHRSHSLGFVFEFGLTKALSQLIPILKTFPLPLLLFL